VSKVTVYVLGIINSLHLDKMEHCP